MFVISVMNLILTKRTEKHEKLIVLCTCVIYKTMVGILFGFTNHVPKSNGWTNFRDNFMEDEFSIGIHSEIIRNRINSLKIGYYILFLLFEEHY